MLTLSYNGSPATGILKSLPNVNASFNSRDPPRLRLQGTVQHELIRKRNMEDQDVLFLSLFGKPRNRRMGEEENDQRRREVEDKRRGEVEEQGRGGKEDQGDEGEQLWEGEEMGFDSD